MNNQSSSSGSIYKQYKDSKCPGCYGTGVQINNKGVKDICPVCGGSGYVEREVDGSIKRFKITW